MGEFANQNSFEENKFFFLQTHQQIFTFFLQYFTDSCKIEELGQVDVVPLSVTFYSRPARDAVKIKKRHIE